MPFKCVGVAASVAFCVSCANAFCCVAARSEVVPLWHILDFQAQPWLCSLWSCLLFPRQVGLNCGKNVFDSKAAADKRA